MSFVTGYQMFCICQVRVDTNTKTDANTKTNKNTKTDKYCSTEFVNDSHWVGRGVIHDSHEGDTFFTWHNRTDQVHSVLLKKFLNSLAFAQCLVTYHHW